MTRSSRAIALSLCSLGLAVSGCSGTIESPAGAALPDQTRGVPGSLGSASTAQGSPNDVRAISQSVQCKDPVGVSAPLRALTPVQYQNSVRALFDGKLTASNSYPRQVGTSLTGYTTDSALNALSSGFAEGVANAADETALSLLGKLNDVLSCASNADRACAEQFVDTYGKRAFRRPLVAEDKSALLAQYDAAIAEHGSFEAAIAELASTLLQHPRFIYLPEFGTLSGGQRTLDDYELASRLSYLLWDAPPDAELLRAASAGELTKDVSQIKKQAERMLDDPAFDAVLGRFVAQWVGAEEVKAGSKDPNLYPELDGTLAASIEEELQRFVRGAVRKGKGGFEALVAGRETYVNAPLAKLYGASVNTSSEDDWVKVTLGPERSGIFTRAAVLAGFAGPAEPSHVRRGKFVRTQLLCGVIGAPPANAAAMQPSYPAGATRREKSEILQKTSPCGGCHVQLDPIGLAFDDFDALGKHLPGDVDVSGDLVLAGDLTGEFMGSEQLADLLSSSDVVRQCVGRQWFRYAFGRVEADADACTFSDVALSLENTEGDLAAMLVSAATSDGFRIRKTTGE